MAGPQGSQPGAASLRWEGLTKAFPDTSTTLDFGSAEIGAGERAVVVGASGEGKTTLLRLIAGLERPTAGRIWFDQREVQSWPAHRRRVAMVFQRPVLYPHLSVRGNLRWAGHGGDDVDELARRLGIAPLLDRSPESLSGGQAQRVAVARAFLRRPGVLLLDEPFSHLDVTQRHAMREWLVDVHGQWGGTIVLVTHDPAEAWMVGQRLIVLSRGKLQQASSSQRTWEAPATQAVLDCLSCWGMNWLAGQLERSGDRWRFRGAGWEFELTGRALCLGRELAKRGRVPDGWSASVVLGVRPTDLRLVATPGGAAGAGEVIRLDWLGDQWVAWVRLPGSGSGAAPGDGRPGSEIRVVMTHRDSVQLGSAVVVEPGSDRLYFFDAVTGQNLFGDTAADVGPRVVAARVAGASGGLGVGPAEGPA